MGTKKAPGRESYHILQNLEKYRLISVVVPHSKWCPDNYPGGKFPPVRVQVWFRASVKIRVGGQFSLGAIVLEPFEIHKTAF